MSAPIRTFRPRRLRRPAEEVHRRLTAEPQALVALATADAISRSAPLMRRWGFTARTLPNVTAEASEEGELGSVSIRWHGAEEITGWPTMTARLLVTPTGPTGTELTLTSTRAPALGLHASELSELHRVRAMDVLVDSFLRALAGQVEHTSPLALEPTGATR
jgi:hypothetical protein